MVWLGSVTLLSRLFGTSTARTRTDLLNQLVRTRGYRNYLEIGVRDRRQNFDKVQITGLKHGVDPAPQREVSHRMTSDAFFAQATDTYDLVFIDGLHLAEQVERDIANSLAHLSAAGAVVLHDCNPLTADAQTDDYDGKKHWNGTVWKAWVKLRATRSDLSMRVIDIDEGCGIVERGSQSTIDLPSTEFAQLTYESLDRDRTRLLNLVTADEFFGR
jgi:predicted O-methyltransferase YrrM